MSYIAGELLDWERFWAPADSGQERRQDSEGFLSDPTIVTWSSRATDVKTAADLTRCRCLILLGDPGMGKTTSLESFVAKMKTADEPAAFFEVHCRDVPDMPTFEARTLQSDQWKRLCGAAADITLVVDGVDEGLRKVPEFVGALADALKAEPMEIIRLIVACRTSEWDYKAGERLINLWPDKSRRRIVELQRLRRRDVRMAAEKSFKDEADAFMTAVQHSGAEKLAARPLTLRMLLEEFKAHKKLPRSRIELYEKAVRRSLEEWDGDRERRLRARKKLTPMKRESAISLAKRIAGLLQLCGRSAVTLSQDYSGIDLTLAEIEGDQAAAQEIFNSDEVESVLCSALFTSRGPGRFGFEHATFAEFLAAGFLADLKPAQIRKILCVEFRGKIRVIPQLAETAAWLAAMNPEWAQALLEVEPEVLLRSDLILTPENLRRRLVDALLYRAAKLEILHHYDITRRFEGLKYSGIASQLRPWIEDKSRQGHACAFAIDMAGMTRCRALEPLLWDIAVSTDPQPDRREAISALSRIAGRHSKARMQKILEGERAYGLRADLLALILKAAVPSVWPLRSLLEKLKSVEEGNFNDYHIALRFHLPKTMTSRDLVPTLLKMRDWKGCFGNTSRFSGLAYRALDMALNALRVSAVRGALVSMWQFKVQNHHAVPTSQFGVMRYVEDGEALLANREKRRALAEVLIEADNFGLDHIWPSNLRLLDGEDIAWVLHKTQCARRKRVTPWARVAEHLIRNAAAQEAESPNSAALTIHDEDVNKVLSIRGLKCVLAGKEIIPRKGITTCWVRMAKVQRLKWRRRDRRLEQEWGPPLKGADYVFACLRRWQSLGESLEWVDIGWHVFQTQDWNWDALTSEDLILAQNCARTYLLNGRDDRDDPKRFTAYTIAGYEAIQFLRRYAKVDGVLIGSIKRDWIRVLHDTLDNEDTDQRDAIAWAYQFAPQEMIAVLIKSLSNRDTPGDQDHDTPKFELCWGARITRAVLAFLGQAKSASLVSSCLENLLKMDRHPVERWIARELKQTDAADGEKERIYGIVQTTLDRLRGKEWGRAWSILISGGIGLASRYVHHLTTLRLEQEKEDVLGHRSVPELAGLWPAVAETHKLTKKSDNEVEPEFRRADDVSILKSSILGRLAECGTTEALETLERLQREHPEETVLLAYYIKDCIQKHLSLLAGQQSIKPEEFLKHLRFDVPLVSEPMGGLIPAAKNQELVDGESKDLQLVGAVYSTVAAAGQIYRGYTGGDHGIDGEIEFKNSKGQASGKRLYVQLKSGDSYLTKRRRDGVEVFQIKKPRWAEYWQQQHYLVMLVIRTSDGVIRWMEVSEYLKRESAGGKAVRQIEFKGEKFDALSVQNWRKRVLGVRK